MLMRGNGDRVNSWTDECSGDAPKTSESQPEHRCDDGERDGSDDEDSGKGSLEGAPKLECAWKMVDMLKGGEHRDVAIRRVTACSADKAVARVINDICDVRLRKKTAL